MVPDLPEPSLSLISMAFTHTAGSALSFQLKPLAVWSVSFVGVSTPVTVPPEMHEAAARCAHWCVERGVLLTGPTCLPASAWVAVC